MSNVEKIGQSFPLICLSENWVPKSLLDRRVPHGWANSNVQYPVRTPSGMYGIFPFLGEPKKEINTWLPQPSDLTTIVTKETAEGVEAQDITWVLPQDPTSNPWNFLSWSPTHPHIQPKVYMCMRASLRKSPPLRHPIPFT